MSRWLVSSISPKATARVLRQLDGDSEALLTGEEGSDEADDCIYGPFGVFKIRPQTGNEEPSVAWSTDSTSTAESPPAGRKLEPVILAQVVYNEPIVVNIVGDEQAQQLCYLPAWSSDILDVVPDHEKDHRPGNIQLPSSEGNEVNSPITDYFSTTLPQIATELSGTILEPSWESAPQTTAVFELEPPPPHDDSTLYSLGFPQAVPNFMNAHQNPILMQAVPLLKHYGTTVVATMTPFRHTNTPWHVMFLAQLKICLATLTLREALDDVSQTTFYGSLAASALSLGLITQSPIWLSHANTFQRRASAHARAVLARAPYDDMDARGYRDALMALLTMSQVYIFHGQRDQAEGFLLETEKLVRMRGLPARKSRKIRLLHHCYVYMRLFHESTFLIGVTGETESAHRRQVRRAVEWSGESASSTDNLTFRLLQWNDLPREMAVIKDQFEGENDLHIAKPGLYPPTMYPEIFGIPESFMFLLSQVIRLGNEKDIAQQEKQRRADQSYEPQTCRQVGDFTIRAKAMERGIEQLRGQIRPEMSSGTDNNNNNDPYVLPSLLEGLQHALSIYFYRRIYDVSSSLIQPQVLAVRDWLFANDQANPDFLYGCFGLVWPAFIAACEADGEQVRESFRRWLKGAASRSGLACFTQYLGIVERVWHVRSGWGGENISWLDIVRGDTAENTAQMLFTSI